MQKDIVKSVIGCRPVSSKLMTVQLRASPFNITIIQVYAPTSNYDDSDVDEFYRELESLVEQTPKQDILVVQGDWNAKVGEDAQEDWGEVCGPSCNLETNDRELKLLDFAAYNNLVLANTLGNHKPSRRWTWHSPDATHHNQIDYILVKKRFRSGIKTVRTRTFPGADVWSDHDMVMMTFQTHLKNSRKPTQPRIRFDLEKLNDPTVMSVFQATIGDKICTSCYAGSWRCWSGLHGHPLQQGSNWLSSWTSWQAIRKRKPWVTPEILDLCDQRWDLKKKRGEPEGAKDYREIKRKSRTEMKMAKETWIQGQCQEVEACLRKNNSKKAYQLVKDLTTEKQGKSTTIQDKSGKCLTEENEILNRWTEYCSDINNYETDEDPIVLDCPQIPDEEHHPILREEVEAAVKALKMGESAGVDNIPAELVQAGGEAMIDILTAICNKIWKTGEWPTTWTQSLVITLTEKGNLQLCQNYRTISLISHPSKVMLKIILNRLQLQAEEIIAEEQAGFRAGRSTTEQIFNLRILCEKYLQHQQNLYHVFRDFKKAFDRVWHEALWATMRKYINASINRAIENLYDKALSAVLFNGSTGEWFKTTVGVRKKGVYSHQPPLTSS